MDGWIWKRSFIAVDDPRHHCQVVENVPLPVLLVPIVSVSSTLCVPVCVCVRIGIGGGGVVAINDVCLMRCALCSGRNVVSNYVSALFRCCGYNGGLLLFFGWLSSSRMDT